MSDDVTLKHWSWVLKLEKAHNDHAASAPCDRGLAHDHILNLVIELARLIGWDQAEALNDLARARAFPKSWWED